jgi:ketosteroid isomerase-like protein
MSAVKLVLFESPLWLGVVAFIGFAIVLLSRRWWPERAARYALPMTLAAVVLLFVVQKLVTTERERILQTVAELVRSVEERDIAGLRRAFSVDYDADGMDADAVVEHIRSILQSVAVRDTRLNQQDVTIDGDRAEMTLGARATVSIHGGVGEFHWGRWRLTWQREPDGWKITSLRPEELDNVPIRSLRELRDYAP